MNRSLSFKNLKKLYNEKHKSVPEIARLSECSENKVNYWLAKYQIKKRTISEAIYVKHNPKGDPFKFIVPKSAEDAELFGLGLGLYWGEGTKANKDSIRLGNTDPNLIKKFIEFLIRFFSIKKKDLHFGLQIFSDIEVERALDFWIKRLKIKRSQFYKPIISISGSIGTYKKKSEYGVLTVMYHNKKLRNLLVELLPK
ncbi:hypothetical protein A2W39_02225 [Candidatus Azambacteria bacterium RIFCSPHIGHO2_01_46_10]|uniref:Homing endonuclease LAGLIDADG domain-containing protein n=1 Tax=Candidatus Azambacteria bacterium RIFCSPHIGHO2_01_46_10 TaxID=1797293 RepID=A0A1F5BX03_9BACT|nr:MAG: hypothetical protein A2W39_02225 [Candidatus Azambacteria bacterium RIFCSPHIGHO2_01_46_10]